MRVTIQRRSTRRRLMAWLFRRRGANLRLNRDWTRASKRHLRGWLVTHKGWVTEPLLIRLFHELYDTSIVYVVEIKKTQSINTLIGYQLHPLAHPPPALHAGRHRLAGLLLVNDTECRKHNATGLLLAIRAVGPPLLPGVHCWQNARSSGQSGL